MDVYYKKVLAKQLLLSDEQINQLKKRGHPPVDFIGYPVRMLGDVNYGVVLKQGDSLVTVYKSQWVVKHPDGILQVLWPHEFEEYFETAPAQELRIDKDPLNQSTKEQSTLLL